MTDPVDLPPAAALGRAVALRRTALGMKRKDLAEASELSYPYISEIENGAKEPSAKALRRIADALDLSERELVTLRDQFDDEPPVAAGEVHAAVAREMMAIVSPTESEPSARPDREPEIGPTIRRIVREELALWEETRLPRLVEQILRRRSEGEES